MAFLNTKSLSTPNLSVVLIDSFPSMSLLLYSNLVKMIVILFIEMNRRPSTVVVKSSLFCLRYFGSPLLFRQVWHASVYTFFNSRERQLETCGECKFDKVSSKALRNLLPRFSFSRKTVCALQQSWERQVSPCVVRFICFKEYIFREGYMPILSDLSKAWRSIVAFLKILQKCHEWGE